MSTLAPACSPGAMLLKASGTVTIDWVKRSSGRSTSPLATEWARYAPAGFAVSRVKASEPWAMVTGRTTDAVMSVPALAFRVIAHAVTCRPPMLTAVKATAPTAASESTTISTNAPRLIACFPPYRLIRVHGAERGTRLMDGSNRCGETDERDRELDALGHGHGDRVPADDTGRDRTGVRNGDRLLTVGNRIGTKAKLPARCHARRELARVDRVRARLGAEVCGRVRPGRFTTLHQEVGDRDQQRAEHHGRHQCGEHDHLTVFSGSPARQHLTPVAHCRKGGATTCASCSRVTFQRHTRPIRLLENETVALPRQETSEPGWYVDEYRYWLTWPGGQVMRSDPGSKNGPDTLRWRGSPMLNRP